MALDKMAGMTGMINPNGIAGVNQPLDPARKGQGGPASPAGVDFRRALEQFSAPGAMPGVGQTNAAEKLKFSNHAVERMRSRGISFQPEEMTRIENAIAKANAKGAKDTLVLSGDNALIVSVKNNTVVTVMDKTAMKENVFTNIDSTVVV